MRRTIAGRATHTWLTSIGKKGPSMDMAELMVKFTRQQNARVSAFLTFDLFDFRDGPGCFSQVLIFVSWVRRMLWDSISIVVLRRTCPLMHSGDSL